MPGIAGIIAKSSLEITPNAHQDMLKCMIHEKFYNSGSYINNHLRIRCGWVNINNSFSDCMPVWNEKKDICLIFSGENYFDQSEVDSLKARGHEFNTENASYLVHLYEEIGIDFLKKLNGYFCGILINLSEGKIILFNDRYGLNRIYYHENKEFLYFASEAKSLLKVLPNMRSLDMSSLGEFISLDCTLENRTLFSGINLVPAGSAWTFSLNNPISKKLYFEAREWEEQPHITKTEYYDNLKKIFSRILPRYFHSKEKVALSLTGGIDTRMIMAWADLPPYKIPCYTFGGKYRDCTDVKVARKVANVCQQYHETVKVNRKFFSEFPRLAKKTIYYTDGSMDVTGAAGLFTHEVARHIAPIRITGNYGDQILRSVIGFTPRSIYEKIFDKEFYAHVLNSINTYNKVAQDLGLSFYCFKQIPWNNYPRFALESSQMIIRSPYLDNELVSLVYQAPKEALLGKELSFRLIAEGNVNLARIPTDRGLMYKPFPIITKVNNIYEEFMFKAEYAYDYGMPHWLARLDNYFSALQFEKLFLGKHKFYHFRVWYRDELAGYVKTILLDQRSLNRPYLNRKFVEEIVQSHIKGYRNYTTEITKLLSIELAQRNLIDK
jgi:asparagine synthase (glutamine-hydrolysing)